MKGTEFSYVVPEQLRSHSNKQIKLIKHTDSEQKCLNKLPNLFGGTTPSLPQI